MLTVPPFRVSTVAGYISGGSTVISDRLGACALQYFTHAARALTRINLPRHASFPLEDDPVSFPLLASSAITPLIIVFDRLVRMCSTVPQDRIERCLEQIAQLGSKAQVSRQRCNRQPAASRTRRFADSSMIAAMANMVDTDSQPFRRHTASRAKWTSLRHPSEDVRFLRSS